MLHCQTSNLHCSLFAGTGNTVIEAVRVLIEHGVQPRHIILLSLFSTPHGKPSHPLLCSHNPPLIYFCLPTRSHS